MSSNGVQVSSCGDCWSNLPCNDSASPSDGEQSMSDLKQCLGNPVSCLPSFLLELDIDDDSEASVCGEKWNLWDLVQIAV